MVCYGVIGTVFCSKQAEIDGAMAVDPVRILFDFCFVYVCALFPGSGIGCFNQLSHNG